ncbi:ATP-grasp fold amidoligase family protein [Afipia felis]|uniref:TupA-like ATPgrasp n=2 Tax=Afipia felis TaxID=1035 RepID=A0A380W3P0_AFIFE|nr:ATP-grasp fold amidoligase family protein [Afipia felis]EKS30292.1 hypothetical protein HMPREF9697_02820 [Afipia felis ATCC 53690]SUU75037.1 Uncharacterised protein [Afipia felis]SUU83103.1 Uncharacterised protein [Afipia felis]
MWPFTGVKTHKLDKHANSLKKRAIWLKARGVGRTKLGRLFIDALLFPTDVRLVYRWFVHFHKREPKLFKPKTFSDKIQVWKLFSRKDKHTLYSDKLAARDFVRSRCGDFVHIPKLYWTGYDLSLARTAELPNKFVIKPNHTSGDLIFVRDVTTFDWDGAIEKSKAWLASDFSLSVGDWVCRWIKPQLFIEELLEDSNGEVPLDYKFFCFNGKVHFVQVDFSRYSGHKQAFYDTNFNRLPLYIGHRNLFQPYTEQAEKPKNFDHMIKISEVLSKDEPFIRIDMYDGERPIMGEIGLHPHSGLATFDPPDWEIVFGALCK